MKYIDRQDTFIKWVIDLFDGKIQRWFFAIVTVFYPKKINKLESISPSICRKLLILSDVGGLGDAVLFRRFIEGIKDLYDVSLILYRPYHVPAYRDIISPKKLFIVQGIRDVKILSRTFVMNKFDCILIHHMTVRNFIAQAFFPSTFRVSFYGRQGIQTNKDFFPSDYGNVLVMHEALTEFFGGEYHRYSFNEVNSNITKVNEVVVHIGSGSLCKNWKLEHFFELKKFFIAHQIRHQFVCGVADAIIFDSSDYFRQLNIRVLKGFDDLIKILISARIVVCHNTSILHLAATLGISTISINSLRDWQWWNPYHGGRYFKEKHIAFTSRFDCGYAEKINSLLLERKRYGCSAFDSITPRMVFLAVEELLN